MTSLDNDVIFNNVVNSLSYLKYCEKQLHYDSLIVRWGARYDMKYFLMISALYLALLESKIHFSTNAGTELYHHKS